MSSNVPWGFVWTVGDMLHVLHVLLYNELQSFLARRSDCDWWLWADNSRGSFLLRVVSSRHFNCSNFQRFQNFKCKHLVSWLLHLYLCVYAYAQADSPTPSLSRASATQPSTLTGWVGWVENCPFLQISKNYGFLVFLPRCDACPVGQKQSTGGSTFCEDCGAPQQILITHDQTCLVRCVCCLLLLNWMMLLSVYLRFGTEQVSRFHTLFFFFFFFVFCCVPPTLLRTEDIAEVYLLFHCFVAADGGLVRGLPADSFRIFSKHAKSEQIAAIGSKETRNTTQTNLLQ